MQARGQGMRMIPADQFLDEGVSEGRQDACVWVNRVRDTQDQYLVCTDDHSDALHIDNDRLFSYEDCCWVWNWCLCMQTQLLLCRNESWTQACGMKRPLVGREQTGACAYQRV